jgi:hypothetical protein
MGNGTGEHPARMEAAAAGHVSLCRNCRVGPQPPLQAHTLLYMAMATALDTRTKRSTKYPACIVCVTSSKSPISFSASRRRRYGGATVTAVTCPCHLSPWPSTFPKTAACQQAMLGEKRHAGACKSKHSASAAAVLTVSHVLLGRPLCHLTVLRPLGKVLKVEIEVVLQRVAGCGLHRLYLISPFCFEGMCAGVCRLTVQVAAQCFCSPSP